MSIYKEFEKLIEKRKAIEEDIDYETNPIIKEMIHLMTADINSTIVFLKNECSEEQFVWLSEIADEITEYTKSREFIQGLRDLCDKYPETAKKYNIHYFVESAAEYLE